MKVFTCIDHETAYPVGGASVVVAETEERAREILYSELSRCGLGKYKDFTLVELDLTKE